MSFVESRVGDIEPIHVSYSAELIGKGSSHQLKPNRVGFNIQHGLAPIFFNENLTPNNFFFL